MSSIETPAYRHADCCEPLSTINVLSNMSILESAWFTKKEIHQKHVSHIELLLHCTISYLSGHCLDSFRFPLKHSLWRLWRLWFWYSLLYCFSLFSRVSFVLYDQGLRIEKALLKAENNILFQKVSYKDPPSSSIFC